MKVAAPGKLMLTGAYAVLEGAPAIVLAVDRFVIADTARAPNVPVRPEVDAVARRLEATAPHIDTRALEHDGQKLGLGSSAAAAVAAAAAILASRGIDLDAEGIARAQHIALEAHAQVQPRGSGADVVACAMGGVVEVTRREGTVTATPTRLPAEATIRAFACGRPTRTSDVLDRLDERRQRAATQRALATLTEAANIGALACRANDVRALLGACARHVEGLRALGDSLGLALVPPELTHARTSLALYPENYAPDDVVLLPSGAGGGDVVLWVGVRAPTDQETRAFRDAGFLALELSISLRGVHKLDAAPSTRK
ncbi:MAG: mevalonate kinase [Polyangiales bacterium]